MKKNEFAQIKGLDTKELREKVKGIKKEIADLVLDKNMKKLKDLKVVSKKRKDLAQVLTVLSGKQLLEQLEPKAESKVLSLESSKKAEKPKEKKGDK